MPQLPCISWGSPSGKTRGCEQLGSTHDAQSWTPHFRAGSQASILQGWKGSVPGVGLAQGQTGSKWCQGQALDSGYRVLNYPQNFSISSMRWGLSFQRSSPGRMTLKESLKARGRGAGLLPWGEAWMVSVAEERWVGWGVGGKPVSWRRGRSWGAL